MRTKTRNPVASSSVRLDAFFRKGLIAKRMVLGAAACVVFPVFAEIRMGAPFTDGAVLQRGMKVPVWGKVVGATGSRRVKVAFAGQSKIADVGADGTWKVTLDPLAASKESRSIVVSELQPGTVGDSPVSLLEIRDVLVGEVWFASGQSNMECPIWGESTRYRDMKGGLMAEMTRLPYVRYVKCARKWSTTPREISAKWCTFTPQYLKPFHRKGLPAGPGVRLSAVAFYYARELYLALDVPIGIVNASWGGTNIDAWTPRSGYDGCDASIQATADYPVKADWNAKTDKRGPIDWPLQQPTVLYNGMVAAFAPMAMRGLIWYQGCHNSRESHLYCAKLHALYEGWRRDFANPDLKFYLVQLAPYKDNWLGICAAQAKFCAEEKNAALAVTADVGNFDDVHPNDKEIVAKRLVVHALKRDYGFDIAQDDSPVVKAVSFKGGQATVLFDNVKDWYVYSPNRSRDAAFELAGADGRWHPARIVNFRKAKDKSGRESETDFIDGPKIVLLSDKVAEPVKVRYMGRPRTSGTLYNEVSLPLGPFEAK